PISISSVVSSSTQIPSNPGAAIPLSLPQSTRPITSVSDNPQRTASNTEAKITSISTPSLSSLLHSNRSLFIAAIVVSILSLIAFIIGILWFYRNLRKSKASIDNEKGRISVKDGKISDPALRCVNPTWHKKTATSEIDQVKGNKSR
ncbi:hypothetical protein HDU67_003185, partial [Dinochytrium kinnereticum]